MHTKCWDTNILNGYDSLKNMLRAFTAIRQIRPEYGDENVLLIENGDLYQGTPVSETQLLNLVEGMSDLPPAMPICLTEMDYDASVLGNHEFNYDWETMKNTYA